MRNLVPTASLTVFVALAAIPIVAQPLPAQSVSTFAGKWKGAADTLGLTNVNIFEDGGSLKVQMWGSCKPKDCDWGVVSFTELPNAMNRTEMRGIATWTENPRFATYRIEGNDLVIETYRMPEPPGPPAPPRTGTAIVNGQTVPFTYPSNRGSVIANWSAHRLQRAK